MGYVARFLWMIGMMFALSGCGSPVTSLETRDTWIDLNALQPLPARTDAGVMPLRVSVAAVVSPRGTVESYQPLLDYLSVTLDRPVELVQRRTYQETNALIESGEVDLAFVCTSAYIVGYDDFGMSLLAAPLVNNEAVYQSFLIVPFDSPAQTLSDLKGRVFAFTDPMSFSGRAYPTYLVQQLDETPETFFSRTFFTYSHDDAIYAVANGLADGAAVDSLVYRYAIERDPDLVERVRVIHQSPTFGIPPVVVSPNLRPQQRATLQAVLLDMHRSQEGIHALGVLGFERFVEIDNHAYDSARQIIQVVGQLDP